MQERLQQFMYHSVLAPEANVRCIADIVKEARSFNAVHAITGVLMFDGRRFAQYIEGPPQAIGVLIHKLPRDHRHVDFITQHNSALHSQRRFPTWSMAYAQVECADPLHTLSSLSGVQALQKLEELMPQLDYG